MLTGLAALVAAIFAGIAAAGQLREARRQSAIALQPAVEGRIALLDQEISSDRLKLIETLYSEMKSGIASAFGRGCAKKAEELAGQMRKLLNRQPGGAALYRARLELRDWLYKAVMVITAASKAEQVLAQQEVEHLSNDEIAAREQKHEQALEDMRIIGEELQIKLMNWKNAVRDEQKKLFEQLRVLGDQATS
jgi:hypothetical protein